jgi:hypothetical protein
MTLYVTRAVGCDFPGCGVEYEGYPGETADVVRKRARHRGWKRIHAHPEAGRYGWSDYCPRHTPGDAWDTRP